MFKHITLTHGRSPRHHTPAREQYPRLARRRDDGLTRSDCLNLNLIIRLRQARHNEIARARRTPFHPLVANFAMDSNRFSLGHRANIRKGLFELRLRTLGNGTIRANANLPQDIQPAR